MQVTGFCLTLPVSADKSDSQGGLEPPGSPPFLASWSVAVFFVVIYLHFTWVVYCIYYQVHMEVLLK